MNFKIDRVIWIVLDGVGAGALPDAAHYSDLGSNTLGNLSRKYKEKTGSFLNLPNLASLGLGNITSIEGVPPVMTGSGKGAFGRAKEQSSGKDTTSGHWEMAGLIVKDPFVTFPNGFPREMVDAWIAENNLPGVLGNKAASGTEIIQELGDEHVRSGKPILYTSADSVWQVAAHEEIFGLERLYKICKSARKNICDSHRISRVIARPFIGNPSQGEPYQRTYHRKDYSILPHGPSYLTVMSEAGIRIYGIGKISSIFAEQGITENQETAGNTDGIRVLLEKIKNIPQGLLFCNLIDFDMLYGHRRECVGFGKALEEFDRALEEIKKLLSPQDLLILSADHGNDPTYAGTDHTREYSPLLAYSPAFQNVGPIDLGERESFADIGATVYEALLGNQNPGIPLPGRSFLSHLF